MATIAFFTPCGGGVDYELLLGSIEHHAAMGPRVILDNTPLNKRRFFKNIPQNVVWVYDDEFDGGSLRTCRFRQALNRAMQIARVFDTELLMHLDCDEFLDTKAVLELFPAAIGKAVKNKVANWGSDGNPHVLPGYSNRLWDSRINVTYPENGAWKKHPHYDGNPDRHPMAQWPPGTEVMTVDKVYHHHVHYSIKEKDQYPFSEHPVAEEARIKWPPYLEEWKSRGVLPSSRYS